MAMDCVTVEPSATPGGQPHAPLHVGPVQGDDTNAEVHTQLIEMHTPFALADDLDTHETGSVTRHAKPAAPGAGSASGVPRRVQGELEPAAYWYVHAPLEHS